MSKKREYDEEYKVQAVKFAKNLGSAKAAAEELQIPVNTLYGWIQKVKTAELDIGCGERSPEEALSIAKENQQLKKRIKALEKENRRLSEMNVSGGCSSFFRCQPSEVRKEQRLNYIAYRTDDGKNAGKIRFYCKALEVSRQAFYNYLKRKKKPWKYQPLADAMLKIHAADEENADYGRIRMFQALQYQKEIGELGEVTIPSEGTVHKVMEQIHLIHKPKRKPNGITKADRKARKSDDLLKRDFTADAPLQKCVTGITEIPTKDGKLYVSAIFDCYDLLPVGLAMADHMRAELCCETLKHANLRFPEIHRAEHEPCGKKMHDNARCESI